MKIDFSNVRSKPQGFDMKDLLHVLKEKDIPHTYMNGRINIPCVHPEHLGDRDSLSMSVIEGYTGNLIYNCLSHNCQRDGGFRHITSELYKIVKDPNVKPRFKVSNFRYTRSNKLNNVFVSEEYKNKYIKEIYVYMDRDNEPTIGYMRFNELGEKELGGKGRNIHIVYDEKNKSYIPMFGLGPFSERDLHLYNEDKLYDSGRGKLIIITEGEKDAETLTQRGLLAISKHATSVNLSKYDDLEVFRDRKILLIGDNDKPGREGIKENYEVLKEYTKDIYYYIPEGFKGKDITDEINECQGRLRIKPKKFKEGYF